MGILKSLFGPKRALIEAERLCEDYLFEIFSPEKRSRYIENLKTLSLEYVELRKVDKEEYEGEIIALHIGVLSFAWAQACMRGVIPQKYSDAMVVAIYGETDSRTKYYEIRIDAYIKAIGKSADLPSSDAIREVTETLIERVGIKGASADLRERLYSEFGALFSAMVDGLKLWEIV